MFLPVPSLPEHREFISRKSLIRRRGWTGEQVNALLGEPDQTDSAATPPSCRWAMSRVLAAEAAHPQIGALIKARSDDGAGRELADHQVILDYVADHPGATPREVVANGRGYLSRTAAEKAIKDLLYREPKMLRSDHPEGTHAFGRGNARLYLAEDGPETLRVCSLTAGVRLRSRPGMRPPARASGTPGPIQR